MRVVLKKSWVNKFDRKYPVGTILQVDRELMNELIECEIAEEYKGYYPPKDKQKVNMSNLKSK